MSVKSSALAGWTAEQIAAGRRWVKTWQEAGPELERIRRDELRALDARRAIELLCGAADYTIPPRSPKPTSGLIEQQRWFAKLAPLVELKEEPEILDELERRRAKLE